MKNFSFENLNVWQRARLLTKEIYLLSSQFPSEEKFGLTNQIRRAVVSISSNLAEGNGKKSPKEQARYTETAYCSLMEVLSQMITASDLEFINKEQEYNLRPLIEEIANKLNKLKESQLKRAQK